MKHAKGISVAIAASYKKSYIKLLPLNLIFQYVKYYPRPSFLMVELKQRLFWNP